MKAYILTAVAVMTVGPVNAMIVFDQPVAPAQGTCIVADPTGTPQTEGVQDRGGAFDAG